MCAEVIEKVRVAKKMRMGRVFTWFEMVLFGFGMLDASHAYAIVDASKKTVPLAKFESSKLVACGPKQPAANEEIVIHVRPEVINGVVSDPYFKTAKTDENGVIDFNKVFAGETRTLNLTARLARDETEAISFLFKPSAR